MASWCSSGARTEPAFTSESGVAPSMSRGPRCAVPSTAASLPRWALSSAAVLITKRRVGSSPGVREGTTKPGAVERDAARPMTVSATFAARKRKTRPRGEAQCVPTSGVCRRDAGNHKLPSRPALLIPLAWQISRKRSKAGSTSGSTKVGACPKQSVSGRRRGPASGRNRGRRLGSHFSGLAGVEAWAPAADLPPFPDRRGERCRAVERGGLEIPNYSDAFGSKVGSTAAASLPWATKSHAATRLPYLLALLGAGGVTSLSRRKFFFKLAYAGFMEIDGLDDALSDN